MKLYGIEDVIPLLNQEELGDLVFKMYAEINGDDYILTTPNVFHSCSTLLYRICICHPRDTDIPCPI